MKSNRAIVVRKFHQQIDDLLPQDGKIAFNDVLQDMRVNQIICVRKNVSCSDDSSPCNLRVGQPILITELSGRFANDFKIATYGIKYHRFFRPITTKSCRIGQSFVHTVLDMDEIEPMVFHRNLKRLGFGQYTIPDVWVKATAFDKINRRIEQIPQICKQLSEIEYVPASFEVYQKIDITISTSFAPSNRAKDTHILCTVDTCQIEYRRSLFGLKKFKSHLRLSLLCNRQQGILQ